MPLEMNTTLESNESVATNLSEMETEASNILNSTEDPDTTTAAETAKDNIRALEKEMTKRIIEKNFLIPGKTPERKNSLKTIQDDMNIKMLGFTMRDFEGLKKLPDAKKDQIATYIAKLKVATEYQYATAYYKNKQGQLYTKQHRNMRKNLKTHLQENRGRMTGVEGIRIKNKNGQTKNIISKNPSKDFYKYYGQNRIKELRKTIYQALEPKNEIKNFADSTTGDMSGTTGIDGITQNFGIDQNLYNKTNPEQQTKKITRENGQKTLDIALLASGLDYPKSENNTTITIQTQNKAGENVTITGEVRKGSRGIQFKKENLPQGVTIKNDTISFNGEKIKKIPITVTMESGSKEQRGKVGYDEVNLAISTNGEIMQHDMTISGGFEQGKATLSDQIKNTLDKKIGDIKKFLSINDHKKLSIEGRASTEGSDSFNLKLTQKRAEALKAYLAKNNIPASKIIAQGQGETTKFGDQHEDNRKVIMKYID